MGVMALYRNTGTQPDALVASTAVFTTATGVMERTRRRRPY
jgi:hypothetical protein